MAFKRSVRNYDGIKFELIRKDLDPTFDEVHDDLSESYYDYWKQGISHPWKGYDVQATPEESKELFDKLHGLIFHLRDVAFHNVNIALPVAQRYDENDYRYYYDDDNIQQDRISDSQVIISARQGEGIVIAIGIS